ncbi:MAG: PEP-CTERM sorting domain-containing protein [Candidatus Thiodiazotropha sp.]|jgi:hypothetical protein
MKKLFSIIGGMALLVMSGVSSAGLITDTVVQSHYVDWWDSYGYTHNINDDGFVLGSAVSGTLTIDIWDDRKGWEEYIAPESLLFIVEAFDFDTGAFSFGTAFSGGLEVNALGALNADGLLDVTIQSVTGDFYVGNSVLSVVTADVPAPSALLLMGLGLVGLVAARRVKA